MDFVNAPQLNLSLGMEFNLKFEENALIRVVSIPAANLLSKTRIEITISKINSVKWEKLCLNC